MLKNHAENEAGRLVPHFFLFHKKVIYKVKAWSLVSIYIDSPLDKTLDYWSIFCFSEKSLGIVPSPHFVHDIFYMIYHIIYIYKIYIIYKIYFYIFYMIYHIVYIILYFISWPIITWIAFTSWNIGEMCITIACFPGCDVISCVQNWL